MSLLQHLLAGQLILHGEAIQRVLHVADVNTESEATLGCVGGMVLGPVMLELGLHPMVAASTSLLLVGASSSSASIEFALVGRLPYGWGVIMFALCAVAGVVGSSVIGRIVRASGRASAIVFLLVFVMAAGGVLTAVSSFSLTPAGREDNPSN